MGYQYETDPSKILAFDLRQKLAEHLGEIRLGILRARYNREYFTWLNLIDSLFIEISQKLSSDEKKDYNKLLENANAVINNNQMAYNGNKKINGSKIYSEIRTLNIWVNAKMEKYDMFGSKQELERL